MVPRAFCPTTICTFLYLHTTAEATCISWQTRFHVHLQSSALLLSNKAIAWSLSKCFQDSMHGSAHIC